MTEDCQRISNSVIDSLREVCPHGVSLNVDLSCVSRWQIGGSADCVVSPSSVTELLNVIRFLKKAETPFLLFGSTSNLLFDDKGLRAVAVQIGSRLGGVVKESNGFVAQAGLWVPWLSLFAAKCGYGGLEHICGIPGTIGGLVCMNGGSLRQSISEYLKEVQIINANGDLNWLPKSDCDFSYRKSRFQSSGEIVVAARFEFSKKEAPENIRPKMRAILKDRRLKFPTRKPNCGSVFKVHDELFKADGPPGAILDRLNFKGYRLGNAAVSEQHANFINNLGGATAEDVRCLARLMRDAVIRETGFVLEPEALFVSATGCIEPLI